MVTSSSKIQELIKEVDSLSSELQLIDEDNCPAVREACVNSGLLDFFTAKYENQRISKFFGQPLYKGMTYRQIADHILHLAAKLSKAQRCHQQSVQQDAPDYYDHIDQIVLSLHQCLQAYYDILPKASQHRMKLSDGSTPQLITLIETLVNAEIIKMDIPDNYWHLIRQVRKNQSLLTCQQISTAEC